MPTKRYGSTAVYTGTALIVAGGWGSESSSIKIELMNTATKQWSTAADLPQPMGEYPQATICGDHFYILGRSNVMYTCSINLALGARKGII